MTNEQIARRLLEQAAALRGQKRNLYRVRAYRHAAEMARRLDTPIEELLKERGRSALEEVPGIGRRLSATIAAYIQDQEDPARN
jgi:DNA polymerase/3'-5' exonuclease PolX